MAVDDDRRQTAGRRRELIIATFSRELDVDVPGSSAARLRDLLATHPTRHLIVSGDIDGLVSATMLARSAPPGWRATALIVKSGEVLLHPAFFDATDLSQCFGVDVYSTYIDNVSNHVSLWGNKRANSNADALTIANCYDAEVRRRAGQTLLGMPSLWAGIQGSYGESARQFDTAGYRYPLGTAHVMLALLESIGRSPELFDREYLPWLIANCDGGLKTIRDYPYNVPLWWSSLRRGRSGQSVRGDLPDRRPTGADRVGGRSESPTCREPPRGTGRPRSTSTTTGTFGHSPYRRSPQ